MLELSFIREQKGEAKRKIDTGGDGKVFANTISTEPTPALTEYPQKNDASLHAPSLNFIESSDLIDQEKLLESIGRRWRERLLEKPSALWVRRTSTVSGPVPFTDREIFQKAFSQKLNDN